MAATTGQRKFVRGCWWETKASTDERRMTHEELAQLIARLLDPTSPESADIGRRAALAGEWIRPRMIEEYRADRLVDALSAVAGLSVSDDVMISNGDGATGFNRKEAARYLLRLIAAGAEPIDAILQLEDLISREDATGSFILALWGVEVSEEVQIDSDTSIVPFHDLPQSRAKKWIESAANNSDSAPLVPAFFRTYPACAIVVKRRIEPPFIHGAQNLRSPERLQFEIADDIRLSLTAVGSSVPLPAAAWFQFDDSVVEDAIMYGGIQSMHIEIVPNFHVQPTRIEATPAREVALAFSSCETNFRNRIRIALERLNAAARRRHPGDQAVELAISFESLLTDGRGGNAFMVALRAAHLTDGDLQEKRNSRWTVEAIYKIRNAVVHEGVTPSSVKVRERGLVSTGEIVAQGLLVMSAIVRRLLVHGALPDWKVVDLGAPIDGGSSGGTSVAE